MKCDRCKAEIGRNEKVLVLYSRHSTGQKWADFLCSACTDDFQAFMKAKAKDAPQSAGGGGGEEKAS